MIKTFWISFCLFLTLSVFLPEPFSGSIQYVSDQLIINLREGENATGNVIARISTDDPLEILEENDEYFKVKTRDGAVGWVHKQYVTAERPKIMIISSLEKENKELKDAMSLLEGEKGPLEKKLLENQKEYENTINNLVEKDKQRNLEITALKSELATIKNKHAKLLEDSRNTLQLITDNKTLSNDNQRLKNEIESLKDEKAKNSKENTIRWFIAGGGVFLVGLIAGGISRKRRYSGYSTLRGLG